MKLIIAGGRDGAFSKEDIEGLDALLQHQQNGDDPISEVVSGGAMGIDACGEAWARSHGIPVKVFKADWDREGRAAGPLRNARMAAYADAVVLFPGGKGTQSMFQEALAHGILIFNWMHDGGLYPRELSAWKKVR